MSQSSSDEILVQLNVRIPEDLKRQIKMIAAMEGVPVEILIAKAIGKYLHEQTVVADANEGMKRGVK
jgi:predicted HicB family RNase H-like nuclease